MPIFVACSWLATQGSTCPAHLKQIAPVFAKKLFGPANSGLMFQMKVGWFLRASALAPVNRVVAPNVANALSFARLACTSRALFANWSSRLLVILSWRP